MERADIPFLAYITVCADEARRVARQAEAEITQGHYRGPLHGIPVAIKDQIYTRGIRTTDASKIRADFVPEEDATVVTNLKSAGAILLGKLNMSEFALGDPISSAFGAIAGYDPKDPYTWQVPVPDYRQSLTGDIRGVKVGLVKEFLG